MLQPPPILEEELPDKVKSKGGSSSVHDEGDEFKRSLGREL